MTEEAGALEARSMRSTPWTLDKTINLPFLLTAAVAFATAISFAAKTDNRLANLEASTKAVPELSAQMERLDERTKIMQVDIRATAKVQ